MIATNYARLFSIEFLHDAYRDKDEILRDIRIEPDETTAQLLSGYRMSLKTDHNKLLCFVQTLASIDTTSGSPKVNVINKPLVGFNENHSLTFRIVIHASRFFDSSNLRLYYSNPGILRFGNESGNKKDALLSLSAKIPAYKNTETYKPGMLVTNTRNLAFEAIRDSSPANPQNTTKTQYWKHVTDQVQYVNQADVVRNTAGENCFALISISFRKNLANQFSLLRKSAVAADDNTILGKEYLIRFKQKE